MKNVYRFGRKKGRTNNGCIIQTDEGQFRVWSKENKPDGMMALNLPDDFISILLQY